MICSCWALSAVETACIVVNAAHYGSDSILVAEARKLLPETEQRAGVVHMPATLSRTDYKKFLQEKRAPKP